MCGIFGIAFADATTAPSQERLLRSAALLGHRGPDSFGVHAEPGLAFAHARLSLLDLSERGKQPFWDPSGHYCLVYNGEVYNFKELRAELERDGVVFRTTTDTEVILQHLIRYGADATLPRLEGMFAFAFYDRRRRHLLLARDRFGIKPLSIYRDGERFVFASEIKAMRPWVELRPNTLSISSYLFGWGGPTMNACFYEGVQIVPPGSVVRLDLGGEPTTTRLMPLTSMLDPAQAERLRGLDANQVVDLVDAQLQRAVDQMLFADAPVGALCSGGVDSSVIMAMAARKHGNLAIFHANVKGPSSELDAATALSRHLKLDLKHVDVVDQDFVDGLPDVLAHYEHPITYHPNSVPFLQVARLVRRHGVKAVLSGEGSDECFLGYQYLSREPWVAFLRRQRRRAGSLFRRIPLLGRLARLEEAPPPSLVVGLLNGFERDVDEAQLRAEYARRFGKVDWNIRTLFQLSYHLRTLLHRNDCLGMAASIEARFPFLDERVVETAINLRHDVKIRFSPTTFEKSHPFVRDKWVVRKVAERYLPRELSHRKKVGFPTSAFQRMTIAPSLFDHGFVADLFRLGHVETRFLFDHADHALRVRLLMLEIWAAVNLAATDRDAIVSRMREHVTIQKAG
jgi:asparagine synthase (glutamine-hydrolysing)